jgi:hypothetical protein
MICKKCSIDKELCSFHKKSNSKTGYQIYCKDCNKNSQKIFYDKNKEIVLERKRIYRSTDLYKEKNKIYESKYKERRKIKRSQNIKIRLGMSLRDILNRCFNYKGIKKNIKTYDLLGYDTLKLKQRLEFQFKEGMSWDNYGEWHIDHKKPISKFDKNADLKIINSLSNLQPLWARDNLSKGNRF